LEERYVKQQEKCEGHHRNEHKVVEELSKLLAVDQNFQQRLAVELTNLESLVRTERIPLANFLIQDAEEHYVVETC